MIGYVLYNPVRECYYAHTYYFDNTNYSVAYERGRAKTFSYDDVLYHPQKNDLVKRLSNDGYTWLLTGY